MAGTVAHISLANCGALSVMKITQKPKNEATLFADFRTCSWPTCVAKNIFSKSQHAI